MAMIWVIMVFAYYARNIISLLPSSFDGIAGFHHSLVKEINRPGVFIMLIIITHRYFRHSIRFLNDRLQGIEVMVK